MWTLLAGAALAAPGASISYAVEPRLTTLGAINAPLEQYGFAPIDDVLLAHGLRARFWLQSGWILGAGMRTGFALSQPDGFAVPTTTSLTETTGIAGHQLGAGFDVEADVGLSVLTHSVGSLAQGGALVYTGPLAALRLGWTAPIPHTFLRVAAGVNAGAALGPPHQNVLWEEPFLRRVAVSGTVALELGFAHARPRWSKP